MTEEHFKLLSEKNFNKFMYPVFNVSRRKPIEYPLQCHYYAKWSFVCEAGIWKPKHSLFMDAVSTVAVQNRYNGEYRNGAVNLHDILPTSRNDKVINATRRGFSVNIIKYFEPRYYMYEDGVIPENLFRDDGFASVDAANPTARPIYDMRINEKSLKKLIPLFKKYSSLELKQIIIDIASCKIRMNYPVRYYNGKEFKNHPFTNYNNPCSFFTFIDIDESDKSIDGKVLSRKYHLKFNTILGYYYMNNCFSCYYDLLPEHFYFLTDNAQLYYRHLIMPFYNDIKGKLSLDQVRERLLLATKDNYMANKTVTRVLEELEGKGFIKELKTCRNKKTKSYRYSCKKTSWKERSKEPETE